MNTHNLYVATFTNDIETFAKIGETKKTLLERFNQEKNYCLKDYVQFQIIPKSEISASIIAKGIETDILHNIIWKNNKLYRPQLNFNGYSECFQIEYFPIIVNHIRNTYNFKYTHSNTTNNKNITTLSDYFIGTNIITIDDVLVYMYNLTEYS